MRKTTVYLPGDLDRALKAKATRTGTPAAELIRAAIRRSLDEDDAPWPRSIGAGSSGRFRAADDEAVLDREWGGRLHRGAAARASAVPRARRNPRRGRVPGGAKARARRAGDLPGRPGRRCADG